MKQARIILVLAVIAAAAACSEGSKPAAGSDAGGDSGFSCSAAAASTNGKACDDGDPCTDSDKCASGVCKGTAKSCDDGQACTADSCADGNCKHAPDATSCVISGVCVEKGAAKPGSPCLVCDPAKSAVGFSNAATACDDGNACSTGDLCNLAAECTGTAVACDDKNECTKDSCDAKKGCIFATQTGNCFDGDPCSTGDTCSDGKCKSGSAALGCDDKNFCTNDYCKPGKGCVHQLTKILCNDGEPCSDPDNCTGGVCVGVKTSQCPICDLLFGATAGKLTQFQIGNAGKIGQGIDVDNDLKTCAPKANCADGIDNSAALLAGFLNNALINGVNDGQLTFVAEFAGYVGENVPFTLNLYYAEMALDSKLSGCKQNSDVCKWLVGQSALSPGCKPKFSFADAMVKNGKLTAGNAETLFAMDANLIGAKNATMYVKGARIVGDVAFDADKKTIKNIEGILGGGVPKTSVTDMINAIDPSMFGGIGLSKADVLDLIDKVLEIDLDVDGDGENESASIGIRFSAVGAVLLGTVK